MKQTHISAGSGKYMLEAGINITEGAISILLCGGTKHHIGSCVLAIPRESLTGTGYSCTSSVVNLPGHKDEAFARPLAERICLETMLPVTVSVGVHVDQANTEDLRFLQASFVIISDQITDFCKSSIKQA